MLRRYFLEVESARIEILESDGVGSPVFFCHGNSSAAAAFTPILEGELGRRHRLVAMSFPGHGDSPPAVKPATTYAIPQLGKVAAGVVRRLDLRSYVLVGHSLGGHALLEAPDLLHDSLGLMLISAPPLSLGTLVAAFRPDPSNGALFAGSLGEADAMALAQCFVADPESPVVAELAETILHTDPAFRPSLLQNLQAGSMCDEWEALRLLLCPLALLLGAHDRFLHADYFERVPVNRLWQGQVVRFEKCGHALHVEEPASFGRVLSEFIAEATASAITARKVGEGSA